MKEGTSVLTTAAKVQDVEFADANMPKGKSLDEQREIWMHGSEFADNAVYYE
jgi:hypothetical protein